jgi:hypothetical protein
MRIAILLFATWILSGLMFYASEDLPDRDVYRLAKTPDGELNVRCMNGADATIRPSAVFGEITVSCGK